jgi:hypothetical protein
LEYSAKNMGKNSHNQNRQQVCWAKFFFAGCFSSRINSLKMVFICQVDVVSFGFTLQLAAQAAKDHWTLRIILSCAAACRYAACRTTACSTTRAVSSAAHPFRG